MNVDLSAMADLYNRTDEDLMARVVHDDHQAFAILVERHTQRFFGTAYRYCAHVQTAEDIVQEAFLKLWLKREIWDPARGAKFTTWFTRIVTNQTLDMLRKKQPESGVDHLDIYPADTVHEDNRLQYAQDQNALESAIEALPERQKAALNLCVYEGLSNKEAAEILDVGVKALESLLMRAKQAIRDHLFREGVLEETITTGKRGEVS